MRIEETFRPLSLASVLDRFGLKRTFESGFVLPRNHREAVL
jgi:hypothetical protein